MLDIFLYFLEQKAMQEVRTMRFSFPLISFTSITE